MGNAVTCFSPLPSKNGRASALLARSASKKSRDGGRGAQLSDEVIRRHAVAAALLFQQHQKNGSLRSFTRSASVSETGVERVKKQSSFTRSSSTRPASDSDSLTRPHQLVNQDGDRRLRGRFVLVHGGGFGAWCWYKTMALLQDDGFQVTAVDLAGSGVHSADPNSISSLVEYVKPLLDILTQVEDGGKVILVGHDLGGACMSYAMEALPEKVAKAVFVAAAMVTDGQSCLDVFSTQMKSNDLIQKAQIFVYGNGTDVSPTAIEYNKTMISALLFNQSPSKVRHLIKQHPNPLLHLVTFGLIQDIALASVSMKPIPIAPVKEKLALSNANYGSIRRFYIQTLDDLALPAEAQDSMINLSPPERLFKLKGSDHAPFFSRPQSLHKLLVEIAMS